MPTARKSPGKPATGPGGPPIDPTTNVIALVEAETRRQDDLRETNDRRIQAELQHLEGLSLVRHECGREVAALREVHTKEMGAAEANRLNAIRMVDQLAVNTAAERALAAIQTLAATTQTTADNIRQTVTSTAAAIANQTAATMAAITERIAALEKSSYEGKGRQGLSDPMLTELVTEMKSLRESRAEGGGSNAGSRAMWSYVVAGFAFILMLLTIAGSLIAFFSK